MKRLEIKLLQDYKSYKNESLYIFDGDLIILSGVNGSGKSQLCKIINNSDDGYMEGSFRYRQDAIKRTVTQIEGRKTSIVEGVVLFTIEDSINVDKDFGSKNQVGISYDINCAWKFYEKNIKNKTSIDNDKLIYSNESEIFHGKNPAWRSILYLVDILKSKYFNNKKMFDLNESEFRSIIPPDFIWKKDGSIIAQVGRVFTRACKLRDNEIRACGLVGKKFDNDLWLKKAPWTILNKIFKDLNFKYSFKIDYEYDESKIKGEIELLDKSETRKLNDLSDGEKTLLKLALFSFDIKNEKNVKLVVFDEFDATLNPSLITSFYKIVNDLFINNGMQIIISTHSSSTISMAPENAVHYEIFAQGDKSPKIIRCDKFNYSELEKVNHNFYTKISNQENRIKELEFNINHLKNGNWLFVEDYYLNIYKIAFLKINNIDGITENNVDDLFEKNFNFSIHGGFSCTGLNSVLTCANLSHDKNRKTICLFDFDNAGVRHILKIKNKNYTCINNDISNGILFKHQINNRFAMLLPIPNRLEKYVDIGNPESCHVEIESLLDKNFLQRNNKTIKLFKDSNCIKVKDKMKKVFWKDLLNEDKAIFNDFKILYSQIESIFNKK